MFNISNSYQIFDVTGLNFLSKQTPPVIHDGHVYNVAHWPRDPLCGVIDVDGTKRRCKLPVWRGPLKFIILYRQKWMALAEMTRTTHSGAVWILSWTQTAWSGCFLDAACTAFACSPVSLPGPGIPGTQKRSPGHRQRCLLRFLHN